jgi:hypothetical protein
MKRLWLILFILFSSSLFADEKTFEKKKPPKKSAAKKPKPRKTSVPKTDSVADEIKKFADLKDQGILTQEEFDAKKKELLGL